MTSHRLLTGDSGSNTNPASLLPCKQFGYLDGGVLAEETGIVLDDSVGLGLVEEVDQLQKLLQGELV